MLGGVASGIVIQGEHHTNEAVNLGFLFDNGVAEDPVCVDTSSLISASYLPRLIPPSGVPHDTLARSVSVSVVNRVFGHFTYRFLLLWQNSIRILASMRNYASVPLRTVTIGFGTL